MTPPLHIGYVLKVFPRLSETFVLNEILELERQGARVTVFSLKSPKDGRYHAKLARLAGEVVYVPELPLESALDLVRSESLRPAPVRRALGTLAWQALDRAGAEGLKDLARAVSLFQCIAGRGVHHLHAHFATSATQAACLVSRLSGIPYSFTAHAKDIYHQGTDTAELREHIRQARFTVTVCDANREHLEALLEDGRAAGAGRIVRIYNGIDLDEFRPPARGNGSGGAETSGDPLRIVGVGRLVPKKGFDTLVTACRLLRERAVPFECRLVGDGEERAALEALAGREGVADRVAFLGAMNADAVRGVLAGSDLCVLPARIAGDGNRDALPTVLLESLAMGLPAVATPVTGIPEIFGREEGGRIVPMDRPDLLADAVAELAGDPRRRAAMAGAGRRRAETLFDVRRNVAQLHSLFSESLTPEPVHAARLS